jgi:DNA-binding CsgD family transcriptional regulator/PAS domain-containing protein
LAGPGSVVGRTVVDELEYGRFVELVYDAALEPDLWPRALERLFDLVGGQCGALTWQNQATGLGGAIEARLDPEITGLYFGYFADRNPLQRVERPHEFMRSWVPRILTDEDWMPKEDLVRTEYYNGFMRPLDVHSSMTVRLAARGLDAAFINIGRPERRGAFDAQDLERAHRLHPHLIHAFALGEKVSGLQSLFSALSQTLDHCAYGLFLVDGDGRVAHANAAAERLTGAGRGLQIAGGRLSADNQEEARRLHRLIAEASPLHEPRAGGSMAVTSADGRAPLSILVAPTRAQQLSMFHAGPCVMVCVTDPDAGVVVPVEQLRDLFGFTPGEARVALALLEGYSPREAARVLGLSFFTVRGHLARIFDKTGVKRQSALVALMLRAFGMNAG